MNLENPRSPILPILISSLILDPYIHILLPYQHKFPNSFQPNPYPSLLYFYSYYYYFRMKTSIHLPDGLLSVSS